MKNLMKDKASIVRTIILILGLVNNMLVLTGHQVLPIDDTAVNDFVTYVITIITVGQAWWFNNFDKKKVGK